MIFYVSVSACLCCEIILGLGLTRKRLLRMMLLLFRKGLEATTEDAPVDAGVIDVVSCQVRLGPAPGDAAVNDVVSCQVRFGPAPGDAAVNDVVPCQVRVSACPRRC